MADLGQAYVQIVPSAQGISGKISNILNPEALSAGKSAGQSIGKQIGSFATKAVAALGVGKAISSSISSGMNFESAMAKASTLFTGTSGELAGLEKQILRISGSTGMAASELAEAAYSAESASVPMGNLGDMIDASSKLAVAGFTDVDTALAATAKTMNAYGMMSDNIFETHRNMEKVQKVLIQTQNKGITTVGELGASLAQVTPTAAAFGVSFEQVGASLAVMTAQGTPTAQATTQLNSLFAELGKEGTTAAENLAKAAKGTEYAGMSFKEMMDSGASLTDVLGMIQERADENEVSMVDMFSSIEAGKAAMSINSGDFTGSLEAMATEADVVGEAFGKMSDTVGFKVDQIKTKLQNMGIEAFSAVADDLSAGIDTISTVFSEIKEPLGDLGSAFLDLGGAAVNAVADLLGIEEGANTTETVIAVLKEVIGKLTEAIQFLTQNMDTVMPIVMTLGTAFLVMKSPLPGIITSIAGLVGNLGGLSGAAGAAAGPVSNAGGAFASMAGQALKMLAAAAALYVTAQAVSVLVDAAIRIADAGTGAQIALAAMAGGIIVLMGAAAALGGPLTAGAVGIGVFGAAMLGIGAGIDLACDGIAKVIDAVSGLTETIATNAEGINSVVSNVGETVGGVITTISEGIGIIVDAIGGAISGVLDSVSGIFDSIGNAALNAGTGFEKMAGAVQTLVGTGVITLGASLGATADGIGKITTAASKADSSKLVALTNSFNPLTAAVKTSQSQFTAWGTSTANTLRNVASQFASMNLAGSMHLAINRAISTASSGISQLHSMFANTVFSFNQSIAVPHFSMSGSFNAESGTVPTVSVSWYRTAAEYGALFTTPQIIGVGDAAQPEVLLGEKKLRELAGGGNRAPINVYVSGAENPEDWGRRIARQLNRELRTR